MIFKGLLQYESYARDVMPYLEDRFFSSENKRLFKVYSDYFFEYNKIPSLDTLSVEVNNIKNIKENELNSIVDILEYSIETKDDFIDEEWLFKKTE